MKQLNVQAIFNSIDGEVNGFGGAGELTTFIRLKGCSLQCVNCDTAYSQNSEPYNWMTLDQIVNYPGILDKITLTGGEPLMQENTKDLIGLLLELGHTVTVETNGSIKIPILKSTDFFNSDRLKRMEEQSLRYIVDYKLPSTGMMKYMNEEIFENLRPVDVIKFVIADEKDYKLARNMAEEKQWTNLWKARIAFSPASISVTEKDGLAWATKLAELMLEDAQVLQKVQFSLQVHKVLWPGTVQER